MMVSICYNLTWNILSTLAFKNSSSSWGSEVLPIRSNTEATTSSISILKCNKDINQMKIKKGTQIFSKVFSFLFSCQATCHLRHKSDILSRSKIVFTYLKITYYYLPFLLYIFLKSRPWKLLTIIMKAVDIAIFYEMTRSIDSMSSTYIENNENAKHFQYSL